ncbi:hypothetical protein HDEF_1553 [Candidatus Hamiltonella defensa 5AT (Acyrthosiphon pisum)]|uniref:Uncharacterized protein n=1 Tax=Hamiltonella defensa subsp. Acyrthosiphon pisum (strain 5AT) TaxID=572265 RepID=C4K6H8_HAMD5|nr:hypothetical protein HDEF_1553 [Candidatus Hamiltonella defensa 5AT (Acyrthosiphon pisum)]
MSFAAYILIKKLFIYLILNDFFKFCLFVIAITKP